ncbi:MAG: hypothetical protein CMP73_06090 [Flavobacteriales bacterium]|nr:hypothetical protein [Flavobacteriales bacterium]
MSKVIAWIKLIRFQNLTIIILTQILIKFCLINIFIDNYILDDYYFLLYLIALIFIVAGGYIINDIFDVKTDIVNKKKIIVDKVINKSIALKTYYLLNIIGLTSGFYLSYLLKEIMFSFIFLFFVVSLFKYSKKYKKSFIIGNLLVSFLTALSIINITIFDIIINRTLKNGDIMIIKIILAYSIFSFIITLIREIIKDLEDKEGDLKINAQTLAIKLGVGITKRITLVLVVLTMLGIIYFQYFQYSIINSIFEYDILIWGCNNISFAYVSLIQIIFLLLCWKIKSAYKKENFYFISQILKLIMILGILSIPLFTFLHIN